MSKKYFSLLRFEEFRSKQIKKQKFNLKNSKKEKRLHKNNNKKSFKWFHYSFREKKIYIKKKSLLLFDKMKCLNLSIEES
jgi:hypothetical protein